MNEIKKQYEELFNKVEKIKNLDLSFKCINKLSDNKLVATFYGHSVAGSYVYAHQVAPNYEKQLEIVTNVKTRWNGDKTRESGMFRDTYEFTFFLNEIININKKELKGRNIYFDGTCAFANQAGMNWAYLYSLLTSFNNANNVDKEIFINSGLNIINNIISFDKTEICEIIKTKNEDVIHFKGHNSNSIRTKFCAYFDLYISDIELEKIYFHLLKRIVKEHIKNNGYNDLKITKIFEEVVECSSNYIVIVLNNFTEIIVKHIHLHLITSEEFKEHISISILEQKHLNNYSFIDNNILRNEYQYHINSDNIVDIFSNFEEKFEIYNNEKRKKNLMNRRIQQNLEFRILIDYILNDNITMLDTLIKKGYYTPDSFENQNKFFLGFNQLDLLLFSKSEEMFKLLSNWIYDSSLSKGFFPILKIKNNLGHYKSDEKNQEFTNFFSNNIFKYINFLCEKKINLLDYEIKTSLVCNFNNIPMFYFIEENNIDSVYKFLIDSLKTSLYIDLLNNKQKEEFFIYIFKQISVILNKEFSCFNNKYYLNIVELLNNLGLELEEGISFVLENKIINKNNLSDENLEKFICLFDGKIKIDKILTNKYNKFRKFKSLIEIFTYFKIINKINKKEEMKNFLIKNFVNNEISWNDYHNSFFINENLTTFANLKSTSLAKIYINEDKKLIKSLDVEHLKLALKKYGKEFNDLVI